MFRRSSVSSGTTTKPTFEARPFSIHSMDVPSHKRQHSLPLISALLPEGDFNLELALELDPYFWNNRFQRLLDAQVWWSIVYLRPQAGLFSCVD
jgi:hypothetical protein